MKKYLLFRHPSELLQSRTSVLRISVTADVKAEVEQLAAEQGLNIGQYLHMMLMGYLYHVKYRPETPGGWPPDSHNLSGSE